MAPWNPVYKGLKAHQIIVEISTGIYKSSLFLDWPSPNMAGMMPEFSPGAPCWPLLPMTEAQPGRCPRSFNKHVQNCPNLPVSYYVIFTYNVELFWWLCQDYAYGCIWQYVYIYIYTYTWYMYIITNMSCFDHGFTLVAARDGRHFWIQYVYVFLATSPRLLRLPAIIRRLWELSQGFPVLQPLAETQGI